MRQSLLRLLTLATHSRLHLGGAILPLPYTLWVRYGRVTPPFYADGVDPCGYKTQHYPNLQSVTQDLNISHKKQKNPVVIKNSPRVVKKRKVIYNVKKQKVIC